MKEFIEKLIERLEKEKIIAFKTYRTFDMNTDLGRMFGIEKSIEIINELKEEYKSKTQADKIRSMSDEELADYIIFIGNGYNEKIPYCKSTPQCTEILDSGRIVPNEMCRECLVKWLQSEA